VKAWGEKMLLGLLCRFWEGQTAFPSLGGGADTPRFPTAVAQHFGVLISEELMALSTCPKEELVA